MTENRKPMVALTSTVVRFRKVRAKDTRRTTPPEVPLGSARSGNADAMKPHGEKQGYDSFEDWYYAEMDVFGSDEYPDM